MNQLGHADVIKNMRKKIDEQSLLFLSVLSDFININEDGISDVDRNALIERLNDKIQELKERTSNIKNY